MITLLASREWSNHFRFIRRWESLVDRPLAQLGFKRRVVLCLPFFVPVIFAIVETDLILAVPRKLAKITAAVAGVRVVEPPREIKAFP